MDGEEAAGPRSAAPQPDRIVARVVRARLVIDRARPRKALAAFEESIALAESGAIQGGLDAMLGLVAPLRFGGR